MEYLQYYDGLSKKELDINPWLIVIIEAASYCESRHVSYIRYSQLRARSNEKSNEITEGQTPELGGTFESIISRLSNDSIPKRDRFLTRINKDKRKKDSRIYPNIKLIQNEVKSRQAENLDNANKILRFTYKTDPFPRNRHVTESVAISESLTRQTAKTRVLIDSATISERLSMIVTHASSKEE